MGTFTHPITLIGPSGVESETLEALVDTGATFCVIATPILERLGVRPFRTMPVRLADGRTENWPMGELRAQLNGQDMPILCLFGTVDAPPLLRAHTLEAFLLTVDPVEQRLVPKEALLM